LQNIFASYLHRTEKFILKYKLDHVFFWLTYSIIYTFSFRSSHDWFNGLIDSMIILSFHALVSYFNIYFLVPRYLFNQSYLSYVFTLLLSIVSVCFPLSIVAHLVINNKDLQSLLWSSAFLFFISLSVLFSVILTMVFKFVKQWYRDQTSRKELQQIQLQTELKFLKAQINPHFLFNSLNNLYALTLKKSDLAPRVVLMLSDILRYVLYESNQGQVSILKEIKHIKDYIEIERLRLGNLVRVEIEISDKIADQNIEPMLLLTLVENAFKHSESVLAQNRYIKIVFENLENGFRFLIENSFNPSKKSIEMGGIGLQNIKKRLTLTYPGKHELISSIQEDVYQVDLIIYFN